MRIFKRILIIFWCIIFINIFLITGIMENDIFHTKSCDVDGCSICLIIQFSVNFLRNLKIVTTYIVLLLSAFLIGKLSINALCSYHKKTLIDLKVIQNK